MIKAGLVLEGGALRGVFTAGVLDVFMDKNLYLSDVFAVSAGTTNALSYISKQKGRNARININYVNDDRYLSFKNYIKYKSVFGFDFIFNDIAKKLEPFDFDTFNNSKQKLVAVATNCNTGVAEYFDKYNCSDMLLACRASCSMPYLAPIIHVNNIPCLDGGISDAVPIYRALQEGNTKNILILTRHKGYRKKISNQTDSLIRKTYYIYPNLAKALIIKNKIYNETMDYIDKLEEERKIFVIRPQEPVTISRTEKNITKLKSLYMKGYKYGLEIYNDIMNYLRK